LGERQVKGKEAPVKAYRVIAPSTRRTRFDVSAERGLTPFLGRERELELLLDGLDRAKSGRGQAFSIMGEAGVGKSRLLYEFRKAIANEDVFFQEGRCLSYSTNVAYHPVIDLLKATYDIHEGDDDDRIREKVKKGLKGIGADEASTLPFTLELLSVKESGIDALNLSPEARKDKTLEALKQSMLKASEMRPLVMAVEDLHWVDKSSEETFKDWLNAISGAQLLLIFTYRPEFVHTWGGKSYHNQVNLNRLSNRETLAMASHILGTEIMGEDLEELILNKTEGIPFFVEEFMKSLKDLGMIEWRDSGYYLAKDIQEVEIPSTIQEVIMARVDSLPDGAKSVLQTGSAIGREFSCELIKRVTGIPTPEMTPHLSVLRDSELLYERGIFPQATYIFRHSLTQEVAYDSLLQKKKKVIHERIGQSIEELYSDSIEEFLEILAYHYSRSENYEKAYRYLKLSGDKATRSNSPWEAFHFYKEAINVLNVLSDSEETERRGIEIRLSMVPSMARLSYPEDSLAILHEGERLCQELGDEKSHARLASTIGMAYSFEGDIKQARKYGETAFLVAEGTDDLQLVVQIGYTLCSSYILDAMYADVAEVAHKVIARIESSQREAEMETFGRSNTYSMLLAYYGAALCQQGDFEQGAALCEKGLRIALQIKNPFTLSHVELHTGAMFFIKGDSQVAAEHSENCIKYAEEAQNYAVLGLAWVTLGEAYRQLGELETARSYGEKGLKINQDIGMPDLMGHTTYGWLGMVHIDEGNLEAARSYIEKSFKMAQNRGAKYFEAWWSIWLARTYDWAEASESAQVEASLLQAMNIFSESELKPCCAIAYSELGALYADTGQTKKALEALKKAEDMMQEMGMDYWLRRTQEVLERVEGK
jgi:predicted ATPase